MTAEPDRRVLRFYLGSATNALGSGLYLTAGVIFLVRTSGLSLPAVGAWMTVGALAGTVASLAIGFTADRIGVLRTIRITYLAQAAGMVLLASGSAPLVAGGLVLFFLGQRSTNGLAAAASAALGTPTTQVAIRATVRAVNNAGIAAGSVVAGIVLGTGDDALLRVVPVVNALSFVVAAVVLPRQHARPAARPTGPSWSRAAVPTRRFVLLAVANAGSTLHFDVQSVLLPIWILSHAESTPVWAVGYVFGLNTVLIVLGQRWHATRMETGGSRRRSAALSGALLAVAFACYASLATMDDTAASLAVLTVGVGVHSAAEVMQANAFGAASLDLADPRWQGLHQSLFYVVAGLVRSLVPATITALLVWSPSANWLLFAAAVVVAGFAGARLIPEAPVREKEVSPSSP